MVLPPPLDPAFVAAEPPYPSRPLRLIFFLTVRADLLWTLPLCSLLCYFLLVVSYPALVTAKPPPPPRSAFLFHLIPTFRADIYGHTKQVFSRQQLYEQVWGYDSYSSVDDVVRACVKHIRRKLGPTGRDYVQTERGVGYRFAANPLVCQQL